MHLRILWFFLPLGIALSWACGVAAEKPLEQLEREVAEILSDPDNVSRRSRIAPVFELATRYASAGQTNKAVDYYSIALKHHPWNLEGQMALAEILSRAGQTNSAREKATLVSSRAETDALLARAARLLGTANPSQLPDSQPWPAKTNALALVPVGDVDAWLIQDVRQELQRILNIPVILQRAPMTIPKPGRDPLHLKAEDLRDRITKANSKLDFQILLRQQNLSTNGMENDEKVFVLTEKLLETEREKEQVRRFREELAFLRQLGPQWDAEDLLKELRRTFTPVGGSSRGLLGITRLDLYSNENRFVFGMAEPDVNCAVLSYCRFTSAFSDEPPNRDRLRERTLKQALSSAGLLFGLERCSDPACARAYPNSLAEHDAKQAKLCSECKQAFVKRFEK